MGPIGNVVKNIDFCMCGIHAYLHKNSCNLDACRFTCLVMNWVIQWMKLMVY